MKNIIEWLYLRQSNNLVYYDKMTQLFNRNWWELYAKKKLNKQFLYLSIIDLDNLKKVNDKQGHIEGDKLLTNFAKELKRYFPKGKIVRLGGDEFLIITKKEPIKQMLKMKSNISYFFSFGVCAKDKNMNLSKALAKADENMYRMKSYKKKF